MTFNDSQGQKRNKKNIIPFKNSLEIGFWETLKYVILPNEDSLSRLVFVN